MVQPGVRVIVRLEIALPEAFEVVALVQGNVGRD